MNPFFHSQSLAAVFIVVNQKVYRSIRGDGSALAILYLGTRKRLPANADAELQALHGEISVENDPGMPFSPAVVSTTEPPWTLTIHLEDPELSDLEGDDKIHRWVARDFKERPAQSGPLIPAAGEPNQAHLIFQDKAPADFDAIDNLDDIRDLAGDTVPDWVTLYATQTDAQNLGAGAGDYGSARDLDV